MLVSSSLPVSYVRTIPLRTIRSYSIKLSQSNPLENRTHSTEYEKPLLLAQAFHSYLKTFPKDLETASKVDKYETLTNRRGSNIKIGLIYGDEEISKRSKLLETLLADPLALGNNEWFTQIENRKRDSDNVYVYGDFNLELQERFQLSPDNNLTTTYRIPSPILSARYRASFTNAFHKEILPAEKNNIEIVELNNKTQGISEDFHLFVNVSSNISNALNNFSKSALENQIVLTVIDNKDVSPSSTEESPITFDDTLKSSNNHHMIKINSALYYEGIVNFLKYDAKAGSQFVDSLIQSNIFELQKSLGWYLSTPILSHVLLTIIYNNLKLQEKHFEDIEFKYNQVKSKDLSEFSELVHSELQHEFIPKTERYFRKNLRWWKLYLKNDNVEYNLKDFFSHNFMPKSIENYNFLRGKIVNKLQNDKFGEYEDKSDIDNPLSDLKKSIIDTRLSTEVQPVVFSAIAEPLLLFQIPIGILSVLAYQFFDFSLNLSIALFSLGLAVGFNHASKKWETFTTKWIQDLFEEIRLCLGKGCIENGLVKELEFRYQDENRVTAARRDILDVIQGELESKEQKK